MNQQGMEQQSRTSPQDQSFAQQPAKPQAVAALQAAQEAHQRAQQGTAETAAPQRSNAPRMHAPSATAATARPVPTQGVPIGAVQKQSGNAPQRQAPTQMRRTGSAAAQKPAQPSSARLPGMARAEADAEVLRRPVAAVNAATGQNIQEQSENANRPANKSAALQSRRRQIHFRDEDSDSDQEVRTKQSHKTTRPRRKHSISKISILALFALFSLAGCGIAVFLQLNSFLFGRFADVEMPNFGGKNVSEIQFNAEYKGFNIKYEDVYNDENPVGTVVGQNPRVPRRVKENANVTLYISAGTRIVEVPSLTRMTRDEAKKMLIEVGLNPIFKPVTDTTALPDTILHTEPTAGVSINYGETVQVYFTRSEDSTKMEVPECVGMATMSEAIRALATAGLSYALSAESVGDGAVTAQLPEAGEMVPRGTVITLTVNGSSATGLDALPQKQLTGADGHTHEYAPSTIVASNEYSIGYTIYACGVCNYFYYDDFTQPSAG